jgi:hypothetical protein
MHETYAEKGLLQQMINLRVLTKIAVALDKIGLYAATAFGKS